MTRAARLARKLAQQCIEPGCATPPLEDNERCRRHRDAHAAANRGWKHRWRLRREQMTFTFGATT